MKKLIFIPIGFIPLVIGLLHRLLLALVFTDGRFPHIVPGIFTLLVWMYVGLITQKLWNSVLGTTILACLPAFAALLLVLFQELINGSYWTNAVGVLTKTFFLSLSEWISRISFVVFANTAVVHVVSFLLLFVFFLFGAVLGHRKPKREA